MTLHFLHQTEVCMCPGEEKKNAKMQNHEYDLKKYTGIVVVAISKT